jgi:hypothetical protein
MPAPLIARRPPPPSRAEQVVIGVFVGGPLIGLWFCWDHDRTIHFDNPWLNLGVHAALILLPLTWVGLCFHKPVVYESAGGEINLGSSTYFDLWPVSWWMMFLMWATPVVASVVLGHAFFVRYLPHPESLATSPVKALVIMAALFGLGMFYASIFLSRALRRRGFRMPDCGRPFSDFMNGRTFITSRSRAIFMRCFIG